MLNDIGFPTVLLIAGPQAALPGFEADRLRSLWRGLCQCAETWRLDLWPESRAPQGERCRQTDGALAETMIGQMLEQSGAGVVVLAAGADIAPDLLSQASRIVGVPDAAGAVPVAATEIWVRSAAEAESFAGETRMVHVVAECFEPLAQSDRARGDGAIALLGPCDRLPEPVRALLKAEHRDVLLPERYRPAVAPANDSVPAASLQVVATVAEALDAADACILLDRSGRAPALRGWCLAKGCTILWPAAEDKADGAAEPVNDPLAVVQSLAQALCVALPDDPARIGDLVSRNLGLEISVALATFNQRIGLFHGMYDVRGEVSAGDLSGSIRRADGAGEGMVNAWVQGMWTPPGVQSRQRATAALDASLAPSDIIVDLFVWGWPVASFPGDAALQQEVACLVGVDLSVPDRARTIYWATDPLTEIQFGRKLRSEPPVVSASDGTSIFCAESAFPFDRNSISLFPSDGLGQRFTNFRYFNDDYWPTSYRLCQMRNSLAGQTAWLIGNGPSVRLPDLDLLAEAGATCFGFNRFHLAHESTSLRPQFTVTGDIQMIEDFGQRIVDESGGIVFVANGKPPGLVGDYVWIRQVSAFPSLFSFEPDLAVTPGGSSVYVALQIGYFLGIRRWYLYGADFSFQFAPAGHGADTFRKASGEGNHFISDYRAGRGWCPPSIENILPSFYGARMLMESEGGFIRNATRGGHLQVFERTAFEEALEDTRRMGRQTSRREN